MCDNEITFIYTHTQERAKYEEAYNSTLHLLKGEVRRFIVFVYAYCVCVCGEGVYMSVSFLCVSVHPG